MKVKNKNRRKISFLWNILLWIRKDDSRENILRGARWLENNSEILYEKRYEGENSM